MSHPPHVLITGASRGIGLAVAQLFARSSYRCTLISRSEEALDSALSSLQALNNSGPSTTSSVLHRYVAGDITSTSPPFWTSTFAPRFPRPRCNDAAHPSKVDVLINCAGITQSSLFTRTSDEDIDRILALNLSALMKSTKFLLRQGYLRGSSSSSKSPPPASSTQISQDHTDQKSHTRSPVIINVASLLGLSGGFGATAYAASKAGVLGFTRALASEYASHKVRVNAVVPGYIETDMTSNLNAPDIVSRIPLGRMGTAEEVAQAVLFLAENQYAHNCVLNLDGGLSAV